MNTAEKEQYVEKIKKFKTGMVMRMYFNISNRASDPCVSDSLKKRHSEKVELLSAEIERRKN